MFFRKNPLQKAIKNEQVEEIKSILSVGVQLNEKNYLNQAINTANIEIIKLLVEAGIDVNRKDPLSNAIGEEQFETVKILLDKGADPNYEEYLHKMLEAGNVEITRLLIDAGAKPHEFDLFFAIQSKKPEIVRILLDAGVSVKGKKNIEPIILAVEIDNLEMIKMLVEAGAEINVIKDNGQTPLYMALGVNEDFNPNIPIVEFLLENGAQSMIVGKDSETKIAYTPGKLDFSLVNVDKFISPLFKVFKDGSPELVDKFVEKVDIYAKANNGMTALHIACRSAKALVVKKLVERGMNINSTEENKVIPFFFIGGQEVFEKIKFFEEIGFNIHSNTKDGYNLLHVSAMDDNADAVEACVKAGINIESLVRGNFKQPKRVNALHLACSNADREATKKLIELGANLNSIYKDEFGRSYSPMQIAKGGLISVLEKAGAEWNWIDKE